MVNWAAAPVAPPPGRQARRTETSLALTAQETQVARLVVEGDTNGEAAAKLFISPATVEYHLRHIYQKLGVSSGTQLARKISQAERNAVLPRPPARPCPHLASRRLCRHRRQMLARTGGRRVC
jgi:DNA-binding CsgD family transcriptional regulator